MSAGIIQLAALSTQKYLMIRNPDISYFNKVYYKQTEYSINLYSQKFNAKPDFGNKLSCSIEKNGDFISKMYLVVDLPSIPKFKQNSFTLWSNLLSKWWINNDHINKISWVEYIGFKLIKFVELEIGSYIIEKLSGEQLYILTKLMKWWSQLKGIKQMTGNTSNNINFSNGKNQDRLYIPLYFWFSRNYDFLLPIISMYNTSIKVHVEFNKLSDLLILGPTHYIQIENWVVPFDPYDIIYQKNLSGDIIYGKYIAFDDYNKLLFFNKLTETDSFISPISSEDYKPFYRIQNFKGNYINPAINSSNKYYLSDDSFDNILNLSLIDSFILTEYIVVDHKTRKLLINKNFNLMIDVTNSYTEYEITSNNYTLPLNTNYACKQILFVPQINKLSNGYFKEYLNYWLLPKDVIKFFTEDPNALYSISEQNNFNICAQKNIVQNDFFSSTNIIKSLNIKYNNYDYSISDYILYNQIVPLLYHSSCLPNGVCLLNFSLYPENSQPSGYSNIGTMNHAKVNIIFDNSISPKNPITLRIYYIVYKNLTIDKGVVNIN